MDLRWSIWSSVLLPVAAGGFVVVPAASWLGDGLWPACAVACGALAGAVCSAWSIVQQERAAEALLRRRELRGRPNRRTGMFGPLVEQAGRIVDHSETEAREAVRLKTEVEARIRVRQKQARRYLAALNALECAVLITDAHDEPRYSNAACLRLLQGTHAAGRAAEDNHPELAGVPPLLELLRETRTRSAATDRRSAEFEIVRVGEPLVLRATATNLYDEDDVLTGVMTVIADIRDECRDRTRHAEFVSSVSHELRTPMASIKAFVEMLLDGDVTAADEQQELYGFIDVQVDRLTRLVDNMLNLARIESGVIKIQREDCELNDVLQRASEVVRPVAEEKQIRVTAELSDMYLAVHIDPDLFAQAIINLLSNAVKYTPAGGDVRLRSRMEESEAIIEVRDTGLGIPADSLPHIFERFYRVPENNKAAAGTGLGLALVHYIVTDVHNGTVDVASAVGQGTSFTIRIPLGHRDASRRNRERSRCLT